MADLDSKIEGTQRAIEEVETLKDLILQPDVHQDKKTQVEKLRRDAAEPANGTKGWVAFLAELVTNALFGPIFRMLLATFGCRPDRGNNSCEEHLGVWPGQSCFGFSARMPWYHLLALASACSLIVIFPAVAVARNRLQVLQEKRTIFFQQRHILHLFLATSVLLTAQTVFGHLPWLKLPICLSMGAIMLVTTIGFKHGSEFNACTWRPLFRMKISAYLCSIALSLGAMFSVTARPDTDCIASPWSESCGSVVLTSLVIAAIECATYFFIGRLVVPRLRDVLFRKVWSSKIQERPYQPLPSHNGETFDDFPPHLQRAVIRRQADAEVQEAQTIAREALKAAGALAEARRVETEARRAAETQAEAEARARRQAQAEAEATRQARQAAEAAEAYLRAAAAVRPYIVRSRRRAT